MNYGKYSISKKQKDFASRKVMRTRKVNLKWFKALLIILIVACCASIVGVFLFINSILYSTPTITADDVSPVGYKSYIVDEDGVVLETLLEAGSNRIFVDIEDIPQDLQDAFVAIEDSRFYDHNGVDIIGIMRAGMVAITTGNFSEGASTITQQLIKNSIFDDFMSEETLYDKFERKIQEIYLALELESILSKETILEDYLNTINMGSNTLGVQASSLRYFDKDVSELTLSECAVLAAITNSPESYNPITYPEANAERREKVLDDMKSAGFITQAEYNEAMADTEDVYARIAAVNALYTESSSSPYSYFTDLTIEAVLEDLQEELGYTYSQAQTLVYSGGVTIISTQDTDIQEIVDTELSDDSNFPSNVGWNLTYAITIIREDGTTENYWTTHFSNWSEEYYGRSDPLLYWDYDEIEPDIELYKETLNITDGDTVYESLDIVAQPQAAFVIIDQSTGQVKAIAGGRGEKTTSLSYNRADEPRQPGSTFKIVSTYAAALDTGVVTLSSVIKDEEIQYTTGGTVNNANNTYKGNVTVRYAIYNSTNTIAVKTYYAIGFETAWEYLMKFGFTTLVHPDDSTTNDSGAATALGGLTNGATPLEMAASYAAIANDGVYIEPTLYTQILDSNGDVLLDNTPDSWTVIQESTAWLLTDALQDVVTMGTGTKASIGTQAVAGKTGTTSDSKDLWFVGYTPYYTACVWFGLDQPYSMSTLGWNSGYHMYLWSNIMEQVHEDLPIAYFEMSSDVSLYTICSSSGLLAVTDKTVLISEMEDAEEILESLGDIDITDYLDILTGTVTCSRTTEYFADGTQPTEYCDCTASGHTVVVDLSIIEDEDDEDDKDKD